MEGNKQTPTSDQTPASAAVQPLMMPAELIAYLRLDEDERNPGERLRNLIRRQGLPVIRRGKLTLFRRAAVDDWLDGSGSGRGAKRRT